jgi:oligopeptidase B
VEDLEACVRALQEVTGLGPAQTCVYGRSAGGYLVGAAVARQPQGTLFRAAYCEVPYVDVLRTASNPALPLTELEYLEFGNPARWPSDFEAILRLSPVDAVGPGGAPGVFVLCRTAENDMQVFAYESFKWVDALRGQGGQKGGAQPKLLALTESSGHFSHGEQMIRERAEDFLLLQAKMLLDK